VSRRLYSAKLQKACYHGQAFSISCKRRQVVSAQRTSFWLLPFPQVLEEFARDGGKVWNFACELRSTKNGCILLVLKLALGTGADVLMIYQSGA